MNPKWTDERLEQMIGNLLRWGVLLSASLVLAGGIGFLIVHHAEPASYSVYHGASSNYRKFSPVAAAVLRGDPLAIIQFGLLLLIATPVARVALALFGFAMQKDRLYTIITTIVLAALLFSMTIRGA